MRPHRRTKETIPIVDVISPYQSFTLEGGFERCGLPVIQAKPREAPNRKRSQSKSRELFLPRGAYSIFEHFNGFSQSLQSCFFLLGFGNPAAVFLAMGVAQFFEGREHAGFLHLCFKCGGYLDNAGPVVLP